MTQNACPAGRRPPSTVGVVATITWGADVAAAYDRTTAPMFESAVLDPVVDRLAELAAGRRRRWSWRSAPAASPSRCTPAACRCTGIELSPHMVDAAAGEARRGRRRGDHRRHGHHPRRRHVPARVPRVQHDHERDHAGRAGRRASRTPPPTSNRAGASSSRSSCPRCAASRRASWAGCSTCSPATSASRRSTTSSTRSRGRTTGRTVDGRLVQHSAPYRYVWPSELDLMARLAGLAPPRPLGRLARRAVHVRQPQPGRRLREELGELLDEAFELAQVAALVDAVGVGAVLADDRVAGVPVATSARGSASRRGAPSGGSP